MEGPKDPWPCVLLLPERFVGDNASLARDNIILFLKEGYLHWLGGWGVRAKFVSKLYVTVPSWNFPHCLPVVSLSFSHIHLYQDILTDHYIHLHYILL